MIPSHQALKPCPLDGEVLTDADGVTVRVKKSPFAHTFETYSMPAGSSIADIVDRAVDVERLAKQASWVRVTINDTVVPMSAWGTVRVKAGVTVNLMGVLRGGASNLWKAVATVAVAVVATVVAAVLAPVIAPVLGVSGTLGLSLIKGLIFAGVSAAGTLAVNALIPTAPPSQQLLQNTSDFERRATYSIGGGRNESRPFQPIPVVLGQHRFSPPFIGNPYTENSGNDQYMRGLYCGGYGPLAISDIKLGETAIGNFDDLSLEQFEGYASDGDPTLYPNQQIQENLSVSLLYDEENIRTTASDVTEIAVDLVATLYQTNTSGSFQSLSATVLIEYRTHPDGAWQTATTVNPSGDSEATVTLSGSNPNTIRQTRRFTVAKGQYDVRLTKTSTDKTGSRQAESINWTAIRGLRTDPVINLDEPLALIALRIRASDQLNGVIDTLNAVFTSKCKSWNGSAWVDDTPTRNPADLFRYLLQHPANPKPLPDARIDLAALQAWHAFCEAEGFTYDKVVDSITDLSALLSEVAAAGRAAVRLNGNTWSVFYEQADDPIVQHFTPRNSRNFGASRVYTDVPHAWRVRFINRDNGYQQDERVVYDDGYDASNATQFETIEFPGVSDPDTIWKFGRYHIAQARLRPEQYTIETDFENLACERGSRVRLAHDVPLIGATFARVKAVDDQTITLDDEVVMQGGKAYQARFRLSDGDSLLRDVTLSIGSHMSFTLSGAGSVPAVGDLVMFGEQNLESIACRVLSIEPGPDLTARLTLVDDAPGVLTAADGVIPPFESAVTAPVDPLTLPPTNPTGYEVLTVENGALIAGAQLSWSPPQYGQIARYDVRYRLTGDSAWTVGPSVTHPTASVLVPNLPAGTYDFEVKAVFTDGGASAGAVLGSLPIAGPFQKPDAVADLSIAVAGDTATLEWPAVTGVLVAGYDIRYSPLLQDVTWSSAVPLLSLGQVTQAQTPARSGTYLIRTRSYAGVLSGDALSVSSNVPGITNFNVVETVDEHPGWAGTKTNLEVDDAGALRLVSAGDLFDAVDVFDQADVFFGDGIEPEGTYDYATVIDLGAVYTSQISSTVDAAGASVVADVFSVSDIFDQSDLFGADNSLWSVQAQVSTTQVDPALDDWSAWQPLTVGNITARALRFRIKVYSFDPTITVVLRSLSITVDMPDRVVAGEDITVPVFGQAVSFSPAFRSLQGVGISAENMVTGDYYEITNKSATGFTIQFKNSGGTPVERTFDYVAKGYGSIAA
jgi:hypothetical protein